MRSKEAWFAATWSFAQSHLPPPPSRVLDLGCGAVGGLVPRMNSAGHDAVGVDPSTPDGPEFVQAKFEQFDVPAPFDTIVASTSLHHVDDLDFMVERIDRALMTNGRLVVIEWAWERFDAPTADWCFARLPRATDDDRSWLHHHHDHWLASGMPWDDYLTEWTAEHGLHRASAIIDALDRTFDRELLLDAPYFFTDLLATTAEDERAAIDAGVIRSTGVHYVARKRAAAL